MTTPTAGLRRRGPARAIWGIAGVCWVVTVAAVLLGVADHGDHDAVLTGSGLAWPWQLAAFAAVWMVMIGAMMLPTTVPLLELFWVVSARQPRPALVRTTMLTPYLAWWLGFAGLALAGDVMVHELVEAWGWLADRSGLVLGGVLVLAGAFQFSDLKKACLTACRSPVNMLWEHYGRGVRAAWALGTRHALTCLGCCWALMLVMFATGIGSLAWMLLLTAVMVAEKTTAWGARLVTPVGVGFIVSGLAISAVALW
jgi:predicted metal-binding membrane protein